MVEVRYPVILKRFPFEPLCHPMHSHIVICVPCVVFTCVPSAGVVFTCVVMSGYLIVRYQHCFINPDCTLESVLQGRMAAWMQVRMDAGKDGGGVLLILDCYPSNLYLKSTKTGDGSTLHYPSSIMFSM